MFDKSAWYTEEGEIYEKKDIETKNINDITLSSFEILPSMRFIFGLAIGIIFFLIPLPLDGQLTVLFSVVYGLILENFLGYARLVAVLLAIYGVMLTVIAGLNSAEFLSISHTYEKKLELGFWKTSYTWGFIRLIGLISMAILAFELGPSVLHTGLAMELWMEFLPLISVVVPLGAIVVSMMVKLGGLDFVGTISRPIMNPAFRLPGKSALDSLASVLGTSYVGLYVTYDVFIDGGYTKRDVYILCTCFVTPSIGTFAIGAGLLDVINLLPVLIVSWLLCLAITGYIVVRLPPLKKVPDSYVSEPDQEIVFVGSFREYFRLAVSNGVKKAKENTVPSSLYIGLKESIKVTAAAVLAGIAFAYPIFLLIETTNLFTVISKPIAPIFELMAIPDAEAAALGLLLGLGGDLIPAIVIGGIGVDRMTGFFILLFSMSQVVYLASTIPVSMDLFQEVPMRFRDLILLFVIRMIIILPVAALITHVVNLFGLFG